MNYKILVFFLAFSLISLVSCVDTSVQNITLKDYKSHIQFVNLVKGVSSLTIAVDGQSLGSVNFGAELPGGYREFPSGAKKVILSYPIPGVLNDTLPIVFETERKIRIFIIGDTSLPTFVKGDERYIWQTKDSREGAHLFPADTFQIRVFHGASGTGNITDIRIKTPVKDTTISFPVAYGRVSSYFKLRVGVPYTFIAYASRDSLSSVTISPESKRRYTVVLYDSAGTRKSKFFIDD